MKQFRDSLSADEDDRVFWAAYFRGKADGKAGRPYDAYDDTVPEQYGQDCRSGYAEGYYDGNTQTA